MSFARRVVLSLDILVSSTPFCGISATTAPALKLHSFAGACRAKSLQVQRPYYTARTEVQSFRTPQKKKKKKRGITLATSLEPSCITAPFPYAISTCFSAMESASCFLGTASESSRSKKSSRSALLRQGVIGAKLSIAVGGCGLHAAEEKRLLLNVLRHATYGTCFHQPSGNT